MRVLKFGGSSVGRIESIMRLKRIVESSDERLVVVVSALDGVTDDLFEAARMAAQGDNSYEMLLERIETRHVEMIHGVNLSSHSVMQVVKQLIDELSNILKGVYLIQDLSERMLNTIVSYGERLSSVIVSALIEGAQHVDSRTFIKTTPQYTKHVVNFELTNRLIDTLIPRDVKVVVCGGYISTDTLSASVTNLGRGGSDYTAAILAAQLDATELEIWTDVPGFMTADPQFVDNAYVIEKLTYLEAMELCNFGVKVIYPPTIFPVYHKEIPIRIKNILEPNAVGTYISSEGDIVGGKAAIKGISSINDTALVTIQGLGMVGVIGVNHRIFRALARGGISVFLVSQAASENTTTLAVKNEDSELAVAVLSREFADELLRGEINTIEAENNLVTIAVVGEQMKHQAGIAGKLFGTLGRNGINVIACAQGSSETNISFVTTINSLRKALNVIHDSFFLSEYQELNLFVAGIGTVGGSLLNQIRQQQAKLMREKGLKINVVGIAAGKRALFKREGIDLMDYRGEMERQGIDSSAQRLSEEVLGMNIFNSVFVDCTASADIAHLYEIFLSHNISVVAANKVAASGPYETYATLKQMAKTNGVKYLFETNVGAGLPIMNTISNLINSGDTILKIEAVLSGTLNFIFNTLSAEIPLSKAIWMAKEAGYAEPDPRIDLSGTDVVRKLVILAREAGYLVEQTDVTRNLFVPERFFDGSLDAFWTSIPELDEAYERNRCRLENEGKKYRFVAKMDGGICSVGLQEVAVNHPFYDLEGSNNMLMITTERYKEYPMIIKGYGAGADVTAAGVFADIIGIANIR